MLAWIIIIVALALFQIVSVSSAFPEAYTYISTLLMFLAALGLLYRVYSMKRTLDSRRKDHELIGQVLRNADFTSAEKILNALNFQSEGDRRRLGTILVEMKAITKEQLDKALAAQKKAA